MDIEYLNTPKKQQTLLRNKNLDTVEKLLRFFPLRYNDFTHETGILETGEVSVLIAKVESVEMGKSMNINAFCRMKNGTCLVVTWFNQTYKFNELSLMSGEEVLIAGSVQANMYYRMWQISSPLIFTTDIAENMKLVPVYSSIQGMRQEYLSGLIRKAFNLIQVKDFYENSFLQEFEIMPIGEALSEQHFPSTMVRVNNSMDRFMFDDMLYFTLCNREAEAVLSMDTPVKVIKTEIMEQVLSRFPYELTGDQRTTVNGMLESMKNGRRINALIQGDVGCGKSVIAFLLAVAVAENGYQAAIMTPNKVLAGQHYEELKGLLEGTGLQVALYANPAKMTAKEKKDVMKGLADGSINIIVGTTSLISQNVKYQNLGFAMVDEEHKFGVMQRGNLVQKGSEGVHTVLMSATPIPRTLAKSVYSNTTTLYSIKEMPPGRKRTMNCVTDNLNQTITFLCRQLKEGHQAYIVCPMIKKNKKMDGVLSVEELYEIYRPAVEAAGYKIGIVIGRTKDKEEAAAVEQTMADFKQNKIQVLLATSVIEVGVNVPNANLIIIHNSEMFGLAGLHQLRGRVGRGKDQAYCIFFSNQHENQRLEIISSTNDGFEVARRDLEMREPGDLLRGVRQSGKNKYIDLILTNQKGYEKVRMAADYLEEHHLAEKVLENMRNSMFYEEENDE